MNELLERYANGDIHAVDQLAKPLPGESFQQQLRRVKEQMRESLHGEVHDLDKHPLDRNHG